MRSAAPCLRLGVLGLLPWMVMSGPGINTCTITDPTAYPCRWTCTDGSAYDLTALKNSMTGGYLHVADDGQGHSYYTGICGALNGFTCDGQGASGLQTWGGTPPHFFGSCATLGTWDSMMCQSMPVVPSHPYASGGLTCKFTGGMSGRNYEVDYNCAVAAVQPSGSATGGLSYKVSISSPDLCNTAGGGGAKQGLSGGSVFLILSCLGVSAYLAGGVYVNNKYHGLTGREALPHRAHWGQVPGLVKDGCDFSYAHAKFAYSAFREWYGSGNVEPALKEGMLAAKDAESDTTTDAAGGGSENKA